uniref:Endonuclease/exonuclease/phosphatase domain-containing protein n=1 Tax=Leersia perrieri TaxID=77586 RepID=A0A0D9WZB7_9ORYZ
MENAAHWKYTNTATGRGYMEADIIPETAPIIHIATTQLESSDPQTKQTCSMERYMQAEHAVAALSRAKNVVLGGDMSWDDRTDMPFPLPAGGGWVDAWTALGKSCESGHTYDGVWNEDLAVFNGYTALFSSLKRRSDRFVCKLQDYKLERIEHKALLRHSHSCGDNILKLNPSCHLGVVLTVAAAPDEPPPRHDQPAAAAVAEKQGVASQAGGQNCMEMWEDDDDDY